MILDRPVREVADELFVVPQEITACINRMSAHDVVLDRVGSEEWQQINRFERAAAELPQVQMPLNHIFTPGAYCRSIFMPAGTLLTSRIHLTEHPFVISKGVVSVWSNDHGWQTLMASHIGVTKAGTRRVLYIHEDTIWTTFHVTDETDPDRAVASLTYDHMRLGHLGDVHPDKLALVDSVALEGSR